MKLDKPSGNLSRDIEEGKKVLVRRSNGGAVVRNSVKEGSRKIKFVASTDGVKRDGNKVRNDGWHLDNFNKNPRFLWSHDQGPQSVPAIGSIREVSFEKDGDGSAMIIDVEFASHPFAEMIFNLYKEDHLSAVSIGWTPLRAEPIVNDDGDQVGWDFLESELLEVSAVNIPADPDAIKVATQRGLIPQNILQEFENVPTEGRAYILDSRDPIIQDKEKERTMKDDIIEELEVALREEGAEDNEELPSEEGSPADVLDEVGRLLQSAVGEFEDAVALLSKETAAAAEDKEDAEEDTEEKPEGEEEASRAEGDEEEDVEEDAEEEGEIEKEEAEYSPELVEKIEAVCAALGAAYQSAAAVCDAIGGSRAEDTDEEEVDAEGEEEEKEEGEEEARSISGNTSLEDKIRNAVLSALRAEREEDVELSDEVKESVQALYDSLSECQGIAAKLLKLEEGEEREEDEESEDAEDAEEPKEEKSEPVDEEEEEMAALADALDEERSGDKDLAEVANYITELFRK